MMHWNIIQLITRQLRLSACVQWDTNVYIGVTKINLESNYLKSRLISFSPRDQEILLLWTERQEQRSNDNNDNCDPKTTYLNIRPAALNCNLPEKKQP